MAKLVLGLGNPGAEYRHTRHNLGFRVVDEIAERRGVALARLECNALLAEAVDVVLAKPQTYMNRSGYAARCLMERRGFETGDILVVFDDAYLPLGRLRLRPGGSPGGHRGLESVLASLRDDRISRLRLGVGEGDRGLSGDVLAEFVLSEFPEECREQVEEMVRRAADACDSWLLEGVEAAMNRFNG